MFRVIAENINVMSKKIGAAMKERNAGPIRELTEKLVANGSDLLDINLGPARKGGEELMQWVVKTVQEVTDLPLYLDTSNVSAIEAGLQVYQAKKGKAVINSISARPERMEALWPLAKKYDAGAVALVLGTEGIPRDSNERAANGAILMAQADEFGIPHEDVWIDPIVVPVSSQQQQVGSCTEFIAMLGDMAPDYANTCGLSNVSNGSPNELRPLINQCYLLMLKHVGLTGAILDGLDTEILNLAKGGRPDLEEVVNAVMDGNPPDLAGLEEEKVRFAKTTKMLLGQTLYSHSWLEL
ncbi:MAG: dihydropteroate synthase [Deltaproteobacteria bacterium]|nr:MAG: dihydropteroate synthase [Deltaproteobacteria bacterium]